MCNSVHPLQSDHGIYILNSRPHVSRFSLGFSRSKILRRKIQRPKFATMENASGFCSTISKINRNHSDPRSSESSTIRIRRPIRPCITQASYGIRLDHYFSPLILYRLIFTCWILGNGFAPPRTWSQHRIAKLVG